MTPVKVLLLNSRFSTTGGIEDYNRHLARALMDAGHEVTCLNVKETPRDTVAGLRTVGLMPENALLYRIMIRFHRWILRNWLRRNLSGYDVMIVGHIQFVAQIVGPCEKAGVPWAVEFYGLEVWRALGKETLAALGQAASILYISKFTKEEFLRQNSIGHDRFALIPPCIDFPEGSGDPPVAKPPAEGRLRLLTVGRLESAERDKGHRLVLRTLARMREAGQDLYHYDVVGGGPDREQIEALCQSLGLQDRVIFHGRVSDEAKQQAYRDCDVFLLMTPVVRAADGSVSGEGFGIVFLEAGACGKPVIGPDVGGSVDVVEDGETGFRIEPVPERLSETLLRLAGDAGLREAMGQKGRERVKQEYSLNRMGERLEVLLADIVEAKTA